MKDLLALQTLQFSEGTRSAQSQAEMDALRKKIPQPILLHYDRMAKRGKKGVAIARNGVCSECHLGITLGRLAGMTSSPGEVHLCDNCSRYLFLPEEALVAR